MQSKTTFTIAGLLILAAVLYLLINSTGDAAHYYLTVEEVRRLDAAAQQRAITVSGAVLGGSIVYDEVGVLNFTIVQLPGDPREMERAGGLEQAIHAAMNDPDAPTLEIVYRGSPPDMLRPEAQAIVSGRLSADGRFYADELRLKCPSRYEETPPTQAAE
ncbi:MAG TPA: cytochrome c maturation protein CcmE [Anaerolineae bacterium]|nr:cytochrome c maturation protein CcmE [Anaerolineae bacterium]